jgi:hypothetical protein
MKRRWVEPSIILGLWTLFAGYMTLQGHYVRASMGQPASWLQLAHSEFTYAYLWAALSPAILWLARRYRFDHIRWYWVLAIHAAACVVLASVQKVLFVLLVPPSQAAWQVHDLSGWVRQIAFSMDYGLLLYGIVLVVFYAVDYHNRFEQGQFERVQPLAQHRLQRVFPAALDVEVLPQPPRAFQSARREPGRGIPAADLRLQRGKRLRARFAIRKQRYL